MMNLDDPATMANSYPHYQRMHASGPIQRNEAMGKWQVERVDHYRIGRHRYRHSQAHRGLEEMEVTVVERG